METPEYRVLWDGPVAVLTMPEEIDITNADETREQLLTIVNQGATVLVADMSRTTFCDSAGITALVRAFRRANEGGTSIHLPLADQSRTSNGSIADVYATQHLRTAHTDRIRTHKQSEEISPSPTVQAHPIPSLSHLRTLFPKPAR